MLTSRVIPVIVGPEPTGNKVMGTCRARRRSARLCSCCSSMQRFSRSLKDGDTWYRYHDPTRRAKSGFPHLHISAHLRHVDRVKARVLCVPPNSHNRSYDGPRAEGADWMRSSDPKGQLLIIATPLPAAKRVPLRATPRDLKPGWELTNCLAAHIRINVHNVHDVHALASLAVSGRTRRRRRVDVVSSGV